MTPAVEQRDAAPRKAGGSKRNPNKARRYTSRDQQRARELHEGGWTITQITRLMRGEGVSTLAETTVRGWVDPKAAERQRQRDRDYMRRKRAELFDGRIGTNASSPEFIRARATALVATCALSMRATAAVLNFDLGTDLSESQVRHMVDAGGTPRSMRAAA